MKLLFAPTSPYARKARVVLAEKRIDCELEAVSVGGADSPVNAYNPLGKVPTLLLDDGSTLYDSRVIVDFLDNVSPIARLIPEGHRERAAVRRWEALADGMLDAALLVRQESQRPQSDAGTASIERQMGKIARGLTLMASDLEARQWCHNERYSLADIAVGCCLGYLEFRKPGGIDWPAGHPGLLAHYQRLLERPAFADTAPG